MITIFVNIRCNNAGETTCLLITLCVKFISKLLMFHLLKGSMGSREKYFFVIKGKKLFLLSILSFPAPRPIKIEGSCFVLLYYFSHSDHFN